MAHTFFASYARLDDDKKRLQNVVFDLRERVRGRLGAANAADVGFFDSYDGIKTAADWEQALGEAARNARVLVCFCSNTYFNSEYCANEFEVFRRRLAAVGARAHDLRVIIPVIWDVAAMPQVVSRYQESDESSGFPADYRQQGLLALQRNKTPRSRAMVSQTLQALTNVIEQSVAGPALPPLATPVVFDELPGVFDNPGAYNVRVGALHDRALRWEIAPGMTIRRLAEGVASKLKLPWRALKVADDIAAQLEAAEAAREAVILVVDESAVTAGAWKVRTAAIDAMPRSTCSVIFSLSVPAGATITPQEASKRLAALMPRIGPTARTTWFSGGAPDQLQARLSEEIVKLRMALIAEDPAKSVSDRALSDAAMETQGIDVVAQPIVSGPGGGP